MLKPLLGRLNGITMLQARHDRLPYMYVRKKAVLSSQIEGTKSKKTDLERFDAAEAGQPFDDVHEVSNYIDTMMYGPCRLEDLPLFMRLIREMHARLMGGNQVGDKNPGEFRRSQNWIGGTWPGNAMFVPAPPNQIAPCLEVVLLFWPGFRLS